MQYELYAHKLHVLDGNSREKQYMWRLIRYTVVENEPIEYELNASAIDCLHFPPIKSRQNY